MLNRRPPHRRDHARPRRPPPPCRLLPVQPGRRARQAAPRDLPQGIRAPRARPRRVRDRRGLRRRQGRRGRSGRRPLLGERPGRRELLPSDAHAAGGGSPECGHPGRGPGEAVCGSGLPAPEAADRRRGHAHDRLGARELRRRGPADRGHAAAPHRAVLCRLPRSRARGRRRDRPRPRDDGGGGLHRPPGRAADRQWLRARARELRPVRRRRRRRLRAAHARPRRRRRDPHLPRRPPQVELCPNRRGRAGHRGGGEGGDLRPGDGGHLLLPPRRGLRRRRSAHDREGRPRERRVLRLPGLQRADRRGRDRVRGRDREVLHARSRNAGGPRGLPCRATQGCPPDGRMRPTVAILSHRAEPASLARSTVTYQAAQFMHMQGHADVLWTEEALPVLRGEAAGPAIDAVVVFDETALLTDERIRSVLPLHDALLVFVTHDCWQRLFRRLLPDVPIVLQRPGVETAIFGPSPEPKRYDIILGGSETPDYPVRITLNRVVREHAGRYGWRVLDMTGRGLMSNPPGTQLEYAPALASAKVAPTGTNRGGAEPARLVTQYFDPSPARAAFDHPFYGLSTPELDVEAFETAGITPRYLETLASETLLVADLPACDDQEWYRDKMVVIDPSASDGELAALIDRWVRDDDARERLCREARRAVLETETSELRARELVEMIGAHL